MAQTHTKSYAVASEGDLGIVRQAVIDVLSEAFSKGVAKKALAASPDTARNVVSILSPTMKRLMKAGDSAETVTTHGIRVGSHVLDVTLAHGTDGRTRLYADVV